MAPGTETRESNSVVGGMTGSQSSIDRWLRWLSLLHDADRPVQVLWEAALSARVLYLRA